MKHHAVVHIGPDRTGSTALQTSAVAEQRNQATFCVPTSLYPDETTPTNMILLPLLCFHEHANLTDYLPYFNEYCRRYSSDLDSPTPSTQSVANARLALVDHLRSDLDNLIDTSLFHAESPPRAFYSSEHLGNILGANHHARLALEEALFRAEAISIAYVIVLRNQFDRAASRFSSSIYYGANLINIPCPRADNQNFSYLGLLNHLGEQQVLPPSPHPLFQDRLCHLYEFSSSVVESILWHELGCETPHSGTQRVNQTLQLPTIAALFSVNNYVCYTNTEKQISNRGMLADITCRLVQDYPFRQKGRLIFSSDLAADYDSFYLEQNELIVSEFQIDIRSHSQQLVDNQGLLKRDSSPFSLLDLEQKFNCWRLGYHAVRLWMTSRGLDDFEDDRVSPSFKDGVLDSESRLFKEEPFFALLS